MFEGARNDADSRLRPTCVYRDPSARRDVPVSLPEGVAASPFGDPGRCAEGEAANEYSKLDLWMRTISSGPRCRFACRVVIRVAATKESRGARISVLAGLWKCAPLIQGVWRREAGHPEEKVEWDTPRVPQPGGVPPTKLLLRPGFPTIWPGRARGTLRAAPSLLAVRAARTKPEARCRCCDPYELSKQDRRGQA